MQVVVFQTSRCVQAHAMSLPNEIVNDYLMARVWNFSSEAIARINYVSIFGNLELDLKYGSCACAPRWRRTVSLANP